MKNTKRLSGFKFIILLSIIFFNHILFSQQPYSAANWMMQLEKEKLILAQSKTDSLTENPALFKNLRKEMAKSYPVLLHKINAIKVSLRDDFNKADAAGKDKILAKGKGCLENIIEKALIPLWMGGAWDFNGVPKRKPDLDHPVACGHFVQKILTDAGFNIQRNGSTWLAYLGPKDFIHSFSAKEPFDYKTWDRLLQDLKKQGSGLYLLGLEGGWGHVLFAKYSGGEDLLLMHAGPHARGASVNYDEGKNYLTEFNHWDHIWVIKIDERLVKKWLIGAVVMPVSQVQ